MIGVTVAVYGHYNSGIHSQDYQSYVTMQILLDIAVYVFHLE